MNLLLVAQAALAAGPFAPLRNISLDGPIGFAIGMVGGLVLFGGVMALAILAARGDLWGKRQQPDFNYFMPSFLTVMGMGMLAQSDSDTELGFGAGILLVAAATLALAVRQSVRRSRG